MSVKNVHDEYEKYIEKWKRCRDAAEGQDAVHAAGESYLPMLTDQSTDDYAAYKLRALFFGATWRTIAGLTGMVFRKAPKVEVPKVVEPLLEDVTLDGTSFLMFCFHTVLESLTVGRLGLLVDYPNVDTATTTQADAQAANLRPMMSLWKAESILNWKTRRVNNKTVLAMVVLEEEREEPGEDEFSPNCTTVYRVLDLDDANLYRQRVFEVKEGAGGTLADVLIEGPIYPLMGNKPLDFIPFYFVGVDGCGVDVEDPPLIDLVDLNLSHYRTTADYEHGCHFTGLPQAIVTGYVKQGDGDAFYIGGPKAWVFPDANADAKYLEFTGEGLGALEKNLARKESQMALLGARMLEEEKKGVESGQAAGIHRSGENSTLATMANVTSIGLTAALQTFCLWAGSAEKATAELNRDFIPIPMDAATLTALVSSWQQGAISKQTLFEQLKKGEVISEARTFDEEEADIQKDIQEATARNLDAMKQQAANEAAAAAAAGGGGGA